MKKKNLVGLLSIAASLGLLAGVVGAQQTVLDAANATDSSSEVTSETYTYGLMGDRASSRWGFYIASCDDTGNGGSFTVSLTKGECVKLVVTKPDTTTAWITYSNSVGVNYSAYFEDDGTSAHNYKVLVEGEYTFTFEANWFVGNTNRSNGLTIEGPQIDTYTMTYTAIVGDKGDYVLGEKTSSIAVTAGHTYTYADFTPITLYGLEVEGYYSDASCATPIPSGTVVTGNIDNVYVKYTYETGSVTYTIDYSAAMDTVFNSGCTLGYRYWETVDSLSWPGIEIGRSSNGTVEVTVPSDASGLQLLAYDANGNLVGNTIGGTIKVTPASDTIKTRILYNGGTLTDGIYLVNGFNPDAAYMAVYNALSGVAAECGTTAGSSSASETMTAAWETIAASTGTDYISHLKSVAARVDENNDHVDGIAGLISVYDFCVSAYSELGNPLNRSISSSAINFLGNADSVPYIAVFSITGVAILALGAFMIIKKKKEASIGE